MSIESAAESLRSGAPVLVVDCWGIGAVVMAADRASTEWVAWAVRYSSGFLLAAMPATRADRLDLPPMVPQNQPGIGKSFTVAVDARRGVTTGISATDRAHTFRTLGNACATPDDLTRPGHVMPICTDPRGVLGRPAHAEFAVDLCALAGVPQVAALATLVSDGGDLLDESGVIDLASRFGLAVTQIDALESHLTRTGSCKDCASQRPSVNDDQFARRINALP